MESPQILTAGKWSLSVAEAASTLQAYLGYPNGDDRADKAVYAWPHYDGFQSGHGPDELGDGDLLTPVLLNVGMTIAGFAGLKVLRSEMEARLSEVPKGVGLGEADDSDIATVARVFALLDSHPIHGVKGTTLSKVLHRKRPELIPLHDRFVYGAYVPHSVPRADNRTWEHYFTLLMHVMRDDLNAADAAWVALAKKSSPGAPTLTPLRALDIIVWTKGKNEVGTNGPEADE